MPIGALALTTDLPVINQETNTCMFPCPSPVLLTVFHILHPGSARRTVLNIAADSYRLHGDSRSVMALQAPYSYSKLQNFLLKHKDFYRILHWLQLH